MTKYNVEVIETLSRVVEIEADSYEEAQDIAEERYNNSDIILDWEDKIDIDYKPYPSQNIANDIEITIQFDKENKICFIGNKNSIIKSHKCKCKDDLRFLINEYLDNHIQYENVKMVEENQKEQNHKSNKGKER